METYVVNCFMGGLILGAVLGIIITLAVATAWWLWDEKQAVDADKRERQRRIHHINHGRIRYNDGLDIEDWLCK